MLRTRQEEEPSAHVSGMLRALSRLGLVPENRNSISLAEPGILEGNAFIVGSRPPDPREMLVGFLRVAPLRYRILEGELARWLLLTQNRSEPRLLIVEVPSLTDRVVETVRELLEAWAPDVAWAVQDAYGEMRADLRNMGGERGMVHVPATETPVELERVPAANALRPDSGPVSWTDSHTLLAKWLFLAGMRRSWRLHEEERGVPPRNPGDLAERCRVSRATAYRFVDEFVRAGLVRVDRNGLDIADPRSFMERWVMHARQVAPQTEHYPVQWHGGMVRSRPDDVRGWWKQVQPPAQHTAVAGFSAAALEKWLRVQPEPLAALHWTGSESDLGKWLADSALFPVQQARDAHFWILRSPTPRSVSALARPLADRGDDRVWQVDPLQMIVDVIGLPDGEQQAAWIAERLERPQSVPPEWA